MWTKRSTPKNKHEIEFISWWSLSVALTFTATTIYKMVSESNFDMSFGLQRFIAVGIIGISVLMSCFNVFEYIHNYCDCHQTEEDNDTFDTISLIIMSIMIIVWIIIQISLAKHIITHDIVSV